jgi:hypothetical protein
LSENITFTSYLLKTLIVKPVLLISFAVVIPAFVLISIPTSALISISAFAPTAILTFALTFIILMVFIPALAELTSLLTPKIAAALSPATCIPTEPQVQP